tara:strand:- start:638 stop:1387 length:750 start_codon:yes stop_codon:yes gene_type:complete
VEYKSEPYLNWAQTIGALHDQARRAGWPEADRALLLETYNLVEPMFTGWCRASGRPFICHLTGVASLVLKHGGSRDEVLAALAHAAIQAGAYGPYGPLVRTDVRPLLASSLPPGCARLVEAYTQFDWKAFIETAGRDIASAVGTTPAILLKLRIANEMDDALDWPFLTERRRREGARECAVSIDAAIALGWPALASEIAAVRDAMAAVPPVGQTGREDYFVPPDGYRLAFPERIRRKLQRLLSRNRSAA